MAKGAVLSDKRAAAKPQYAPREDALYIPLDSGEFGGQVGSITPGSVAAQKLSILVELLNNGRAIGLVVNQKLGGTGSVVRLTPLKGQAASAFDPNAYRAALGMPKLG